jgi:hypothetical protein
MSCPTTFSGGWNDPYEGVDLTIDSPFTELPAHPTGNPADWATSAIGQLQTMSKGDGWIPALDAVLAAIQVEIAAYPATGFEASCTGDSDGGTVDVPMNPSVDNIPFSGAYSTAFLSSGGTASGEFMPTAGCTSTHPTYSPDGASASFSAWDAFGAAPAQGFNPLAIYTYTPDDYAIAAMTPDEPGERLSYSVDGAEPEAPDEADQYDIDYANLNPGAITSRTFSGAITAPTIGAISWTPGQTRFSEPTLALPAWLGAIHGINAPTLARPQWADVVSARPLVIDTPDVDTPTWDFDDPNAWTDFAEYFEDADPWISAVLLRLQAKLEAIRNGEFSIGPGIWNQIYERAASEIILQGRAREKEGAQAWAARGWNMPGGTAIRMQQLAATEINQMTAKKALEIATQEALQKDQQFQFATQQGLATEQLLEDAWKAMLGRGEQAYVARVRAISDILGVYRRAQSDERITQFKAAADALVEQAKLHAAANSDAAKLQSDQEVAQFQGAVQLSLKQADADTQAAVEGARIVSTQDIEQFRGGVSINTERARIISQMRIEAGRISSTEYVTWFERLLAREIEQAKLIQTASVEGARLTSSEAIATYQAVANALVQDAQNQLNAATEQARIQSSADIAVHRARTDALIAGAQNLTTAAVESIRAQVGFDTAHMNAANESRIAGAKNLTDAAIATANVQVQADTAGIGQEIQAAIAGARNLTDASIATLNARTQYDTAGLRAGADVGIATAQNDTQASIEQTRADVQFDVACLKAKTDASIEGKRNATTLEAEGIRADAAIETQRMQSCTQASIATAGNQTQASVETARGLNAKAVAMIQGQFDFYGRALGVESSAAQAIGNIYAQLAASMYNMYNVSWSGSQSAGVSKSYGVSKGSSVSRSSGTSCTTSYSCEC